MVGYSQHSERVACRLVNMRSIAPYSMDLRCKSGVVGHAEARHRYICGNGVLGAQDGCCVRPTPPLPRPLCPHPQCWCIARATHHMGPNSRHVRPPSAPFCALTPTLFISSYVYCTSGAMVVPNCTISPKKKQPRQKPASASIAAAHASAAENASPTQCSATSCTDVRKKSVDSAENITPHSAANCLGGPGRNCGLEPNASISATTAADRQPSGAALAPPRKRSTKSTRRPSIVNHAAERS
eukprot:364464-Chlamydomonas_euryale.AAC.14